MEQSVEVLDRRTSDGLFEKMRGIEKIVDSAIGSVTSQCRKDVNAAEDRLRREIEQNRKDEAAAMFQAKTTFTSQISKAVQEAEERIFRRIESERREQKEAMEQLRRQTSSQIAAQQDTASFTTQRVVPKETEEMAALRVAMEDVRTLATNSKKDISRLAQDLAEQRRVCDSLQMSIQQLPKHNEEMLTLKLAVEKAENLAQQAKKLAEKEVTLDVGVQSIIASTVGDMDADIRTDIRHQLAQVQSEVMLQVNRRLEETQQLKTLEVGQYGSFDSDKLKELKEEVNKLKDANLELRLAKLETLAQRAANYSDAGDATLFTTSSRRPLGVYGENKLVTPEEKIQDPLTREERREDREGRSRQRRLTMDTNTPRAELESFLGGLGSIIGKHALRGHGAHGEINHETQPLVSEDLKSRLENLVEQVKATLNATNFDAILDSKPRSYEGYDQAAIADGHDEQVFYEDGNYQEDYDGLNEHEQNEALEHGVEYVPNGYIPNGYVPNGYVPNGHVANGPLLQYQPQGIQSEGQMHFSQYDQPYVEAQYMQPMVATPIAQPLHHFNQTPMAPSHGRCCGSIALPISREAERYSEQDRAVSELGQSMYAHPGTACAPDYGMMGSLDGETYAGDNGGGYEALYEQPGYIDVPQVPYTSVSYGPPTVVGVGPPVVHSVTTRVGRAVSPVREHSPVRGRGASPVRGVSPIRATLAPITPNPRHRELSPLRARSVGDPASFAFQPGLVANMSPAPVNVMTSGATTSPGMIPPATIKENPPKEEDEDSSSDEEEEKPSTGTGVFGRLLHYGSA